MDPRSELAEHLPSGYGTSSRSPFIAEGGSAYCDCEDAPCCGCERDGDPRTDDEIKQQVYDAMSDDGYYDDHPMEGME